MQETQVRSLGWEDPLEKGMATTLGFLPGKSHGQQRLVGYSLWVIKRQTRLKQLSMHTWTCVPSTSLSCLSRRPQGPRADDGGRGVLSVVAVQSFLWPVISLWPRGDEVYYRLCGDPDLEALWQRRQHQGCPSLWAGVRIMILWQRRGTCATQAGSETCSVGKVE